MYESEFESIWICKFVIRRNLLGELRKELDE